MSDPRVAFLVAGVQKAGTSALHDYLAEVPDLQLPACKEAHWFDDETVDWAAPDPAPLHALFADDGRMRGEATPVTLYWPGALERARAYNPQLRLILLFRDPVERAFSHWRMEWAKRKETLPFAVAIRGGRARMAAAGDPRPGFHRVFSYVERGFYGRQLARAQTLFPADRILCMPHRLLDRDPQEAVARVCGFLGVAKPRHRLVPRRVREAAEIDYPSALTPSDSEHLRAAFAAETDRFLRLAPHEDWGFGG